MNMSKRERGRLVLAMLLIAGSLYVVNVYDDAGRWAIAALSMAAVLQMQLVVVQVLALMTAAGGEGKAPTDPDSHR